MSNEYFNVVERSGSSGSTFNFNQAWDDVFNNGSGINFNQTDYDKIYKYFSSESNIGENYVPIDGSGTQSGFLLQNILGFNDIAD